MLSPWARRFPGLNRLRKIVLRPICDLFVNILRVAAPVHARWGPPKGLYSEYELLQQNKTAGRVFLKSQQTPLLPPHSLREASGMDQDKFQPWPVFWIRHDEARLIARSLVRLDEKKRLSLEGAFGPSMPAVKNDPAYRTCFLTPATRLEGNWTSVVTQLCEGYYHWLMDALPHLVMLPELPPDTRIIVPPRLAAFQLETLQWLNLEGRCRPTPEKHLLVEHYFFCRPTSMTGCYNPYAVEFLRRSFLHHADESYVSPRRFYLRRVGKIRPIINEAELLEFFQTRGWAIVDTEQMSLSQQIRLFSQAEMICAPHGAGLTNLLWCQPGCKVLELCTSSYLNGVFEGLAQCVGANYRYLIFKGDYGLRSVVNIPEIAKALDY